MADSCWGLEESNPVLQSKYPSIKNRQVNKWKPVHPKENQPWTFIGRTDAEAPVLWPPGAKIRLLGKDPDAGKDWGQEEKGATEDEMVGWHHQLDGHEFEQAPGLGDGQGGLVCKDSDMTERLSWLTDGGNVPPTIPGVPLAICLNPHLPDPGGPPAEEPSLYHPKNQWSLWAGKALQTPLGTVWPLGWGSHLQPPS